MSIFKLLFRSEKSNHQKNFGSKKQCTNPIPACKPVSENCPLPFRRFVYNRWGSLAVGVPVAVMADPGGAAEEEGESEEEEVDEEEYGPGHVAFFDVGGSAVGAAQVGVVLHAIVLGIGGRGRKGVVVCFGSEDAGGGSFEKFTGALHVSGNDP